MANILYFWYCRPMVMLPEVNFIYIIYILWYDTYMVYCLLSYGD